MSRHRSPSGRSAYHGPPLPMLSAAGVGGAHRSSATLASVLPTSLPARVVATVVAGGALATAGSATVTGALPSVADGANVLRLGLEQGSLEQGSGAATADAESAGADAGAAITGADVAQLAVLPPIGAEALSPSGAAAADAPGAITAENLVKVADLHEQAAVVAGKATAAAKAVEAARVAEAAKAAQASRAAQATPAAVVTPAAARGGVQMVVGRISSGFGPRGGAQHMGLDIAAPIGTPIRVPLNGTVISSGPASGFGLWVRVRHDDGTITTYGHINRSLVSVGQRVTAGQQIAEVGNRGQSTGPHLHLEVTTPGGQKINPKPWLDSKGIRYN
ncbi:M23 family metallopeptidase [Pseudonocardia sp. H11422]|uniref:M23 family metallopeptidase n=1 Tax=Pseudonocardia sp. H11422 TaxID=2835866 RepID=UPI0027E21DE3|nr:M23 family metallopeptidase [Pseudonocardia sp. H11422]